MGRPSKIDRFVKHYDHAAKYPLTEQDKEVLRRWEAVRSMIQAGRTKQTIVGFLMKQYGVSRATAYNDYRDCQFFYGRFEKTDKEFWRGVMLDWMQNAISRARQTGDLSAEDKLYGKMMKLLGLDRESPDIPNFAALEPHQFILNIAVDNRQATVVNLDKPEEIDAATRRLLMESLSSDTLSKEQMMKLLEKPDEDED